MMRTLRDSPPLARRAAVTGVVALAACTIGALLDATAFFQAWLIAWLFLLGIALASMMAVMIHELTGGAWGLVLRPPLEAAMATLPLLTLFALPLLFGLRELFPWAEAGAGARDPLLAAKHWYLNLPGFVARNLVWLLAWSGFALVLRRRRDARARASGAVARRRLAVAGLLVYLFTITLAAFDWIASLTPQWSSSAIGIRLGTSQFVGAFGFAVPFAVFVAPERHAATRRDFQDLGNLLLTFAMMWAYIAFMQYLIVWGEDLPRETIWYWPRTQTTWRYLVLPVVLLCFALPVVSMLFRSVKRSATALAVVCALALVGQWLDTVWLVAPSLRPEGVSIRALDVLALIALGGLWLAFAIVRIPRAPADAAHAPEP